MLNQYLKQRGFRLQREEDLSIDEIPTNDAKTMEDIKFEAILSAYERNHHHAQRTCKELKISKATFYRAMNKNNYRIVRRATKKGG